MADTACLMHGSSYASLIPNEPMQENAKHALGESISFGRFMTDQTLSWEKWSTFPHKTHVEEAARYSQPGSVAQKKAFFEAHYKKIAAQKAAALLEQENAAKAEFKGALDKSNDSDVKMEEVKIQDAKNEHSTIAVIEHGKDGGNAVITGNEALRESPAKRTSINRKRSSSKSLRSLMNLLSASTKGVSSYTEPNTQSENTRDKKTIDTPPPGSKARPEGFIKSAVCSKTLRTDERATKRKQEKAGQEFRKLSCSFCFKAQPTIDESNKNGDAPRTQKEKAPVVQSRPAELERSNSKKMHGPISVPSPPPPPPPPPTFLVKNSPSKNFSKK